MEKKLNIQSTPEQDMTNNDLLPFPRYFAECVAELLSPPTSEEINSSKSLTDSKFKSSIGLVLK